MSQPDHHVTALDKGLGIIDNLKPLKAKKSPVIAAVSGFFCGGIGLGIYFQSWLDFFVPIAIWIVVAVIAIPTAEALDVLACIFCCFYGYRRAVTSNAKLDALNASAKTIGADILPSQIKMATTSPPPLTSMRAAPAITVATIPAELPPTEGTIEKRLKNLKDLRDRNVISEAEYQAKRQQILDAL